MKEKITKKIVQAVLSMLIAIIVMALIFGAVTLLGTMGLIQIMTLVGFVVF